MANQISPTRLLLLDDHALFREGAARLLNGEPDFQVVGSCGSIKEALAILSTTKVDVLLLDVDLGKERCFGFFKPARENGFSGKILVVAAVVSPFELRRLIQSGVAGVFLKQNTVNLLVDAIRSVMQCNTYIDPALQDHLRADAPLTLLRGALTDRERAVLSGVCEGLANKEIAARVHISEALVKATLQQLFDKHGVRTRSQLVRVALEQYSEQLQGLTTL
jgi:DNA-binding NarL/FixJ family response regulator